MSALFFYKVLQPENMVISRYVTQDSSCVFDTFFETMQNKEHASFCVGLQSIVVFIFHLQRTEIDKGFKSPKYYSSLRYEAQAVAKKNFLHPSLVRLPYLFYLCLFIYSCSI